MIRGENYIVVNYRANSLVTRIWVLWKAQDAFFSTKKRNTNARSLNLDAARAKVEVIYSVTNAKAGPMPS